MRRVVWVERVDWYSVTWVISDLSAVITVTADASSPRVLITHHTARRHLSFRSCPPTSCWAPVAWLGGEWQRGTAAPGRSRLRDAQQPHQKYFWLTITKVSMVKFPERAKSSISLQTLATYTFVANLFMHRERKCADTIGTVPVPWAGHFQC